MSDAIFNLILNIDFSFIFLFHLFFLSSHFIYLKVSSWGSRARTNYNMGWKIFTASSTPHPYPIPGA